MYISIFMIDGFMLKLMSTTNLFSLYYQLRPKFNVINGLLGHNNMEK